MNTQDHLSNQQPVLGIPAFEVDSYFGVDGDGLCEGEIFSLSDQLQLSRDYRTANLPLKCIRGPRVKKEYPKCDK